MSTEITCIIVDDELENQTILARMIDQFCPTVKVLGKAENVDQAVALIRAHQPDVVFLDIEMPGGNGFTLFDKIENPAFCTIFTTAHAEYAIKAIKFAAFDYLLKPVNLAELKNAVERFAEKLRSGFYHAGDGEKMVDVLRSNHKNQKYDFTKIALPTSEGIEFYEIADIVRCEADRAYCVFHMVGKKRIVISKSLKEYEDLLSEANFFRVHKSNMVNAKHITKYVKGTGGFLKLSDDSMVAVATRKKESVLNWLRKTNAVVDTEELI
jgi:two-component system, LytTR family, response regulator